MGFGPTTNKLKHWSNRLVSGAWTGAFKPSQMDDKLNKDCQNWLCPVLLLPCIIVNTNWRMAKFTYANKFWPFCPSGGNPHLQECLQDICELELFSLLVSFPIPQSNARKQAKTQKLNEETCEFALNVALFCWLALTSSPIICYSRFHALLFVDSQEGTWYPMEKLKQAERKLRGYNPAHIMRY